MIREGDIGEKLFPDFPDMKVDFSEIGIGKIGLAPPPNFVIMVQYSTEIAMWLNWLARKNAQFGTLLTTYLSTILYLLFTIPWEE